MNDVASEIRRRREEGERATMSYRILEPGSDRLKIGVQDVPGTGGSDHRHSCLFRIENMDASSNPAWDGTNQHALTILMQCGPVGAGKPANGVTEAALLAIVAYRLNSRRSPALAQVEAAIAALREWQEQLEAA